MILKGRSPFTLSPSMNTAANITKANYPLYPTVLNYSHTKRKGTIYKMSHAYQQATDWHKRRPEI